MSAESACIATLLADAATTALVGPRIRMDRGEQRDGLPLIAISRDSSLPFSTIDGTVMATMVTLEVRCVAVGREAASAIADAAAAAIRAVPTQTVVGRAGDFDPESEVMYEILAVEWWET